MYGPPQATTHALINVSEGPTLVSQAPVERFQGWRPNIESLIVVKGCRPTLFLLVQVGGVCNELADSLSLQLLSPCRKVW